MKEINTERKVRIFYHDLSIPLKIAVVLAWMVGILYAGAFFAGFFSGLGGY